MCQGVRSETATGMRLVSASCPPFCVCLLNLLTALFTFHCYRADPFVEVGLSEKGEHLLGAAGEVHLETVVKDLKERFARVAFQVGVCMWGTRGGAS